MKAGFKLMSWHGTDMELGRHTTTAAMAGRYHLMSSAGNVPRKLVVLQVELLHHRVAAQTGGMVLVSLFLLKSSTSTGKFARNSGKLPLSWLLPSRTSASCCLPAMQQQCLKQTLQRHTVAGAGMTSAPTQMGVMQDAGKPISM